MELSYGRNDTPGRQLKTETRLECITLVIQAAIGRIATNGGPGPSKRAVNKNVLDCLRFDCWGLDFGSHRLHAARWRRSGFNLDGENSSQQPELDFRDLRTLSLPRIPRMLGVPGAPRVRQFALLQQGRFEKEAADRLEASFEYLESVKNSIKASNYARHEEAVR